MEDTKDVGTGLTQEATHDTSRKIVNAVMLGLYPLFEYSPLRICFTLVHLQKILRILLIYIFSYASGRMSSDTMKKEVIGVRID